jgi:hypothetical protein
VWRGGELREGQGLAFTFAEKAARKGLLSAALGLGYYAEVGVGGPKWLGSGIRV